MTESLDPPYRLDSDNEAAIRELHAGYWARTDGRDEALPEELFSQDAVFILGNLTLRGVNEIAMFFAKRRVAQASSGRITRHLSAELRLRPLADGRVATSSVVLALAGSGTLPITSSAPSVGDFTDLCVRQADGRWLFERREAVSVFAGPEAPRFAQAKEPSLQV